MRSNAALALLALCATAAVAVGDCSLADRRTEVVLENRFVRARVDMMKGHITSLVHKPSKKELVNPLGLYKDNHLESGHWTGPFRNTPYFYKIVKNTPAEASLHMWSQGKDHLIMRKRLTLRRGESVLRVKHRMACAPTLYVDSFYSYRSHNGVGVPGERVTFFVPSSKGAKPIGLAIQGRADTLTFDPPQAWTGFVGESGVGAVFELDFRYLRYYSNWTEQKRSTCEWFFNTLKVPAGGGVDFESDLLVFDGMNRLDGARSRLAGGVGFGKPGAGGLPLDVRVVSARPLSSAEIVVTARRLPNGRPRELLRKTVALPAGRATAVQATLPLPGEGTYVVAATVSAGGKPLLTVERPYVKGKASAPYVLRPDPVKKVKVEVVKKVKDHPLTDALVTPHIAWAKPYAGGKVKALFLTDHRNLREVAELKQRFDLDAHTVLFSYGGGGTRLAVVDYYRNFTMADSNYALARLLKREPRFDVVVMTGNNWLWLDKKNKERVSKVLADGAGLVVVSPPMLKRNLRKPLDRKFFASLPVTGMATVLAGRQPAYVEKTAWRKAAPHFLSDGCPLAALPKAPCAVYTPASGANVATPIRCGKAPVAVARDGKPRVLVFTWKAARFPGSRIDGLTPAFEHDVHESVGFDYWEYYYSLLGKGILWAARREPTVGLSFAGSPPRSLTLANRGAAGSVKLDVRYRDKFGRELSRKSVGPVSLPAGAGKAVPLPAPPPVMNGVTLVDAVARDARSGKVVTWGSASFETAAPTRIKGLKMGNAFSGPGPGWIKARVTLQGDLKGTLLRAEVVDSWGRLVYRHTAPPKRRTQDMFMRIQRPLASVHTLRVSLWRGKDRLDEVRRDALFTPARATPAHAEKDYEIHWFFCQYQHTDRWHLMRRALEMSRRAGLSGMAIKSNWEKGPALGGYLKEVYRANYTSVGECPGDLSDFFSGGVRRAINKQRIEYQKTGDRKYLVRPVCASDPAVIRRNHTMIARTLKRYEGYGLRYALISDEASLAGSHATRFDFCFGPHCLKAFREDLRHTYPSVAALNREWGTSFARWGDVTPMTEEQIKTRANLAPWLDHRMSMIRIMYRFLGRHRSHGKRVDPLARYGIISLGMPFTTGVDFTMTVPVFEFISGQVGDEMLRSLATGELGGTRPVGRNLRGIECEHNTWRCLFHFLNGGQYYAPVLMPDFTLGQQAKDAAKATRRLRRGLGKYVRSLARDNSGVGVYYSQPSFLAACAYGVEETVRNQHLSLQRVLEDIGLQYDYIGYRYVSKGKLGKSGLKVLVLSNGFALSAKEAKEILDFARRGGTVVCDVAPGVLNEHGRPVTPPFDAAVGLKRRKGRPVFEETTTIIRVPGVGHYQTRKAVERNVRMSSEDCLAVSPFGGRCRIRPYGKGRVVYLGFLFDKYTDMRLASLGVEAARLMRAALGDAVTPLASVGADVHPAVEMFGMTAGDGIHLTGMLRPLKVTKPDLLAAKVRLPRRSHLYDVKREKYLGHTDAGDVSLRAGESALFAELPYRITGLRVTPAAKAVRVSGASSAPELSVDLRLDKQGGAPFGRHVVALSVIDPDGKEVEAYFSKVWVAGGRARLTLPVALNSPPGEWRLRAKETLTGVSGEARFTVER